jgi:hypothetical protein
MVSRAVAGFARSTCGGHPRVWSGRCNVTASTQEAQLLGGKTIGVLAVVAISGVTGAVGVLVAERARVSAPTPLPVDPPVTTPMRPRLVNAEDVRTTELHRKHLGASTRIDCADCHELRANEFLRPSVESCVGCHENQQPAVHREAPAAAACLSCHDFLLLTGAAGWAGSCESCHAQPQGTRPAITSHKERCTECHAVHSSKAPADCSKCHDTQTTKHAAGHGAAACLACHPPHSQARLARERCVTCHVDGAPGLPRAVRIEQTAIFAGHDRCTQCHDDHAFVKTADPACRDCHADRPVAPAHAACVGCHEQHAAQTRVTAATCKTCHAGKHVLASRKVAAHADCRSCHDPHQPTSPAADRCATCHAAVAASKHSQGRTCVTCHPPHTDLGSSQMAQGCSNCHAEPRMHGRAVCRDCHPKHGFVPREEPAFCSSCHAKPIAGARAIVTSEGHVRCSSCHAAAAHRPNAPRPACSSCHAAEASSAPAGHADCKSCHDVHSGKRRPDVRCETCHADRTHTPHVRVAGGCTSCHRPHGPNGRASPPTCGQCHTSLPGMHLVAKHANCRDCHSAHEPEIRDREKCLRCHTDRRQHEPNAILCQACHTFGGGK